MKNKLGIIKTEKGATFVEIMLAVAILAIIAVPLLSTVIASVRNNATAKEKTEAIALAEMAMGNIKAQTSLSVTTSPAIYLELSDGALDTYYAIKKVDEAKVSQNSQTQFTYDTNTVQKADFELNVDQTELNIGGKGTVDITVKDSGGNIVDNIDNIHTVNDIPELKIEKAGTDYKFTFSKGKDISRNFTPQKHDAIKGSNEITIKVTYKGSTAGTAKPLRINTTDESPPGDSFIIYLVDSTDHKPGVSFINKGAKDFNLAYITSDAFDYKNDFINELFEVTVIIKNKSQDKEIYRVSSYVKK